MSTARPGIDPAKLAFKGSRVLTQFRADQERQRREHAAEREMRDAMATFSRHSAPLRARPARSAPAAQMPRGGFETAEQRGFSAAESDRLTAGWTSHNTGINADLERALGPLRARSRSWAVNTDIGRRYISLCQDNIVGKTVPRLQVRATMGSDSTALDTIANTAIEQHWARWSSRCEISGKTLLQTLRAMAACAPRDGEYLVRRLRDKSLPYGYAIQLLDVDRIWTGNGSLAQSVAGNVVRLGVEIDTLGRGQALHLYSSHPNDGGAARPLAERVPMNQLFHGFVLERPEQLRGYPWAHAVLRSADMLAQYKDYALVAAKFGAAKMGFYTIDKDAPGGEALDVNQYKDATGGLAQEVEAGMLEALPPGVNFEGFDPKYPVEGFEPFVSHYQRDMAAGLNVAHHNLTGNMSGVNYSSARIAELQERDHWRGLQAWLIESFLQPLFEEWLSLALLTKSITLPSGKALPADRLDKFLAAASFQPRSWSWVDPEADVKAAVTMIDNRLRSHRQIADEQGVDLDDVITDEAAFRTACAEAQLPEKAPAPLQPSAPMKDPAP